MTPIRKPVSCPAPARTVGILCLAGVLVAACGPNRGPAYGVDPVDSRALAIPPDLAAEPLVTRSPFPDLPDASRMRPGPLAAEKEGGWAARVEGNTMSVPVPVAWALGGARAALLLQGVPVDREREGYLRTPWLTPEDHRHLGVQPPEEGRVRYVLELRDLDGGTRITAQGTVRDGDDVRRADAERVTQFLQALQPAFGKRRAQEGESP